MGDVQQMPIPELLVKMIVEILKRGLTEDVENFSNEARIIANARFGLGAIDFFIKHKKSFEIFRDGLFQNVGDEATARRVGKVMSKMNTLLKSEGILESDVFKDLIFLEMKRLNEADEQNRELGKYMEEGWNSECN